MARPAGDSQNKNLKPKKFNLDKNSRSEPKE